MDQLFNVGKQFLNNQGQGGNGGNENQQQQQGGEQYNRPGGQSSGGGFNIGDLSGLVGHAENHGGNSGDSGLFSQAASFLQSQQGNMSGHDVDENQLMQHADKVNNSNVQAHSSEIGNAAALNAIKSVLGGGGSGGQSSGGGDFQQKLIGAAMGQAASLFDQKNANGAASGDKQDAVNQAGQMVMKLLLKNQVSGMIGGGNSGGLGSLMKLIS